nr:leucine-rich repeat domain-containing protein [Pedobacter panaciterrae]
MALKPHVILQLEVFYSIKILDLDELSIIDNETNCYFRKDENDEIVELALKRIGIRNLVHLGKLKSLKKLDLSYNRIKNLANSIATLPLLNYLDLRNNTIENIEALKPMISLEFLDLSENKITDLSPLYPLLKKGMLVQVFAKGNKIEYPPLEVDYISTASILEWIDSHLSIAREKVERSRLNGSVVLDLGNCGLTDISFLPELFEHTELQELYLSNEWANDNHGEWELVKSENIGPSNNIYNIPPEIAKLKNLEILICGGDWRKKKNKRWNRWRIKTFTSFQGLRKLKVLNVSNNRIHTIGTLKSLQALEKLHLNNNLIKRVRNEVVLFNLSELYLSNNYIKDISFLNAFPNIRTVDLHANSIEEITSIKSLIEKLDIADSRWQRNIINVAKNKGIQPPLDIIAQGKRGVLAHFEQSKAELQINLTPFVNHDVKLILVGNSNAGKSTFVNWLLNDEFSADLETTHWLEIREWDTNYGTKKFKLKIFDFGGQEYYHDTHHLFFTTQTAYVLLWDKEGENFNEILIDQKRDGESKKVLVQNYPLDYWLDSIRHYCSRKDISDDEARIDQIVQQNDLIFKEELDGLDAPNANDPLVEQNAADILVVQNKIENQSDKKFLNEAEKWNKFPNIFDFSRMSILSRKGLEHTKMLLFDMIQSISLIDQGYLATWGIIKSEIEQNKKEFKKELSFSEFKQFCNMIIRAIPEVRNAGREQVEAVLFNDVDTDSFAKYLNNIGLLLYFPENDSLKERVFVNQEYVLDKIYNILEGVNELHGEFNNDHVYKALKFLSFNDECKTIMEVMGHFKIIIPHPVRKDYYLAPLYLPKQPLCSVGLFLGAFGKPVYRYIFTGFIHKTIILDFFHIYGGKVLKDKDNQNLFYYWREGIIVKDELTHEILLVKFINGDLKKEKACIEIYKMKNSLNDEFLDKIDQQLLQLTKGMNVHKAVTVNGENFVPIYILEEMAKKELWVFEYEDNTYRLSNFKKHLNLQKKMKNIFISYSKDDLVLVDTFIRHLAALRQDGKVANWFCTELTAGKEWEPEIKEHFDQSDIVCFMVSPNFMKTKYILDHEVKWAFEKKAKNPVFRIVPIILDFCRWTTVENNLGDFTALPYTAKPVVDFKNQNMAWYIIIELIRIMIEKDLDPKEDDFYAGDNVLPKDVMAIYKRIVTGSVDA